MPYPIPWIRQSVMWDLPGGEVATINVGWQQTGGTISIDAPTADGLKDKSDDLWAALKPYYNDQVAYRGCVLHLISVGGASVQTVERTSSPVVGTGAGNMFPHEVAVCVSLKTATAGRSGRGRLYLPPPRVGTGSAVGRLNGSTPSEWAAILAGFLTNDPDNDLTSIVASKTTNALHPVTEVGIGDVFDSQRRRRNELVEIRSTFPV